MVGIVLYFEFLKEKWAKTDQQFNCMTYLGQGLNYPPTFYILNQYLQSAEVGEATHRWLKGGYFAALHQIIQLGFMAGQATGSAC